MFAPKMRKKTDTMRVITRYSAHQELFWDTLTRNCHFLSKDNIISKYFHTYPEVIFRKSISINNRLIHSHLQYLEDPRGAMGETGTYRCGECDRCPWLQEGNIFELPRGNLKPKFFADTRQSVVYLMTCICGAFYVRNTKRTFSQHMQDHLY